ncbi:MAG: TonB family protein [Acidobacteriia bacterium]|nr:TonB family protein [Terriglobia bacterium]
MLPKLFAPFFSSPVYVDVRLTVDANGSVRNANVLTPHLNPALAKAALDSTRQWRFRPAREGDEPVASQVVIRFKLDPHS